MCISSGSLEMHCLRYWEAVCFSFILLRFRVTPRERTAPYYRRMRLNEDLLEIP